MKITEKPKVQNWFWSLSRAHIVSFATDYVYSQYIVCCRVNINCTFNQEAKRVELS